MPELTKYDSLINDLSALETQISIMKSKCKDTLERNADLQQQLDEIRKENNVLVQRIQQLEEENDGLRTETEQALFNTINLKERENLKLKLQNLISRIDNHLSS